MKFIFEYQYEGIFFKNTWKTHKHKGASKYAWDTYNKIKFDNFFCHIYASNVPFGIIWPWSDVILQKPHFLERLLCSVTAFSYSAPHLSLLRMLVNFVLCPRYICIQLITRIFLPLLTKYVPAYLVLLVYNN